MPSGFSLISNICPGKTDWKLKVRIIRLWYIPEFRNPDEVSNIEMIILDEKSEKIGLLVKKKYISSFRGLLQEGATYIIQNLLVALNDIKFQTTKHKFKLHFLDVTDVALIEAAEIPKYHFDFMSFSDILAATHEDKLLDIIGHVVENNINEIQTSVVRKKVIDIVIQDLEMNSIACTLWGEYAVQMQEHLENCDEQAPVIIVLQLCKLKKCQGKMGISNAYFGTKIYLDTELEVIEEYRNKMEGQLQLSQVVTKKSSRRTPSISDQFLQMKRKTLLDLIETTETGFGSVLAQVVEVEYERGWFYQSCFKCYKKVTLLNNRLHCAKCQKSVIGFPRYMVHVKVIDDSASASFVMFDGVLKDYIGKEAAKLVQKTDKEIKLSDMPPPPVELQNLVGKQYLFKVQIKDFNINDKGQSYNVKKISEDKELINKFIALYNIKLCNVEEETDYMHTLNDIAEENPLTVLEEDDSLHKPSVGSSNVKQPPKKSSKKRAIAEM